MHACTNVRQYIMIFIWSSCFFFYMDEPDPILVHVDRAATHELSNQTKSHSPTKPSGDLI